MIALLAKIFSFIVNIIGGAVGLVLDVVGMVFGLLGWLVSVLLGLAGLLMAAGLVWLFLRRRVLRNNRQRILIDDDGETFVSFYDQHQ